MTRVKDEKYHKTNKIFNYGKKDKLNGLKQNRKV